MAFEGVYREIAEVAPTEYYVRPGGATSYHTKAEWHAHEDPLIAQRLRFEQDTVGWSDTTDARLAVIDKANPHTVTETMIAVFGLKNNFLTFSDASHDVGREILRWIHGYIGYAVDPSTTDHFGTDDHFLRVGINIDHETEDRGSLQGVRLLHPHCISFPSIPKSAQVTRRLDLTAPNSELVSVIDPLAKIGPQVLDEHFRAGSFPDEVYETFSQPDNDEQGLFPLAFSLRMRDSWDTLLADSAATAMAGIDATMSRIYKGIRRAVAETENRDLQPWQRHTLHPRSALEDNINNLPVLSDTSKQGLITLATSLKDIDTKILEHLRLSRKAGAVTMAERILTYMGLTYGLTFYSPGVVADMQAESPEEVPAYLAIQPFLMRASGVAGVSVDSDGMLFKVDRHTGVTQFDDDHTAPRQRRVDRPGDPDQNGTVVPRDA